MKKLNPKNYPPPAAKTTADVFYVSTHVGWLAAGTRPTVC